nr:cysteine-rich receptor-like protein kinase [Tanacetum cinerariifolium]
MDAKHLKDFRPISLIGCQYKIIGKILANRLSLVIGDIVSQEQSAFIKGRQIMDGTLVLNEVISWCNARKEQLLMFKVDFQKAFDSVRWDHLDDILGKFSFRIKWHGWIRGCLQSSKALILVNGSCFGFKRYGDIFFKEKFKWLFNLELQKNANVASKLQASNVASSFRQPPRSGIENLQFIELGQILSSISLSLVSDRWSWTLHGLADLLVKSAREEIDKHFLVVPPLKINGPRSFLLCSMYFRGA